MTGDAIMLRQHPHTKLFALLFLIGCGETITPPESSPYREGEPGLAAHKGGQGRRILLRDRCGGESWIPFGGCLIDGKVERPEWLARVQETGSHPAWKNTPKATAVETGTTLEVVNVGGRGHTFTRVATFGGGILPVLNTREDTRIPAPECLGGLVNIRGAGGSVTHTFTGVGEQRYQCCFHPWMRTTVKVTHAHGN
jgi:plastocyanin